jgi:hypothetical protein
VLQSEAKHAGEAASGTVDVVSTTALLLDVSAVALQLRLQYQAIVSSILFSSLTATQLSLLFGQCHAGQSVGYTSGSSSTDVGRTLDTRSSSLSCLSVRWHMGNTVYSGYTVACASASSVAWSSWSVRLWAPITCGTCENF